MWHTSTSGIYRKQRANKCLVVGKHVSDWGEIGHEQLSFLFKLVGSAGLSKTTCIQRCQNSLAHKPSMAQDHRKVWKSGGTCSIPWPFDVKVFASIPVKIWILGGNRPLRHGSYGTRSRQLATAFVPKLLLAKKKLWALALALTVLHSGDIFVRTVW